MLEQTSENIEILKSIASLTNTLHEYVYLREDNEGRYIEYAFIDGIIPNNRCLSWYDKLHPNKLKVCGYSIDQWNLTEINKIYKLSSLTCDKCFPGYPLPNCIYKDTLGWTKEEPVKCACWRLNDIKLSEKLVTQFDHFKQNVK